MEQVALCSCVTAILFDCRKCVDVHCQPSETLYDASESESDGDQHWTWTEDLADQLTLTQSRETSPIDANRFVVSLAGKRSAFLNSVVAGLTPRARRRNNDSNTVTNVTGAQAPPSGEPPADAQATSDASPLHPTSSRDNTSMPSDTGLVLPLPLAGVDVDVDIDADDLIVGGTAGVVNSTAGSDALPETRSNPRISLGAAVDAPILAKELQSDVAWQSTSHLTQACVPESDAAVASTGTANGQTESDSAEFHGSSVGESSSLAVRQLCRGGTLPTPARAHSLLPSDHDVGGHSGSATRVAGPSHRPLGLHAAMNPRRSQRGAMTSHRRLSLSNAGSTGGFYQGTAGPMVGTAFDSRADGTARGKSPRSGDINTAAATSATATAGDGVVDPAVGGTTSTSARHGRPPMARSMSPHNYHGGADRLPRRRHSVQDHWQSELSKAAVRTKTTAEVTFVPVPIASVRVPPLVLRVSDRDAGS